MENGITKYALDKLKFVQVNCAQFLWYFTTKVPTDPVTLAASPKKGTKPAKFNKTPSSSTLMNACTASLASATAPTYCTKEKPYHPTK